MPYSEPLAERIRRCTARRKGFDEKAMFGGVGFLLNGHMCVGVWKESLVARLGAEQAEAALAQPFVGEFDITGRPMTGWVLIAPQAIADDDELRRWIDCAIKFVRILPAK